MHNIALALQRHEAITTPDGEEWRRIAFPNFRQSPCPRAWKYVSSKGRLMSDDLQIATAKPGKGYFQTSLPIHVPDAVGGMTTVALHRIVAYTFLGPPPSPHHTVDHLDRVRENNRVDNLAWVDLTQQLANREMSRYTLRVDNGSSFSSIAALASFLNVSTAHLASLLRQARSGDRFVVQNVVFCVQTVSRTLMAAPTTCSTKPRPRSRTKRRFIAFQHYVEDKMTIADITKQLGISKTTALSYLGNAARESSCAQLQQLAARLGLAEHERRMRLYQQISTISRDFTPQQFHNAYRNIVLQELPHLRDDWEVVRQTLRCIISNCDDRL